MEYGNLKLLSYNYVYSHIRSQIPNKLLLCWHVLNSEKRVLLICISYGMIFYSGTAAVTKKFQPWPGDLVHIFLTNDLKAINVALKKQIQKSTK